MAENILTGTLRIEDMDNETSIGTIPVMSSDVDNYFSQCVLYATKINVQCVPTIQLCTRFLRILILTSHLESNLKVHVWIRPFNQV